jgi:hypothetical protein
VERNDYVGLQYAYALVKKRWAFKLLIMCDFLFLRGRQLKEKVGKLVSILMSCLSE